MTWTQLGDFQRVFDSGASLNRQVCYQNNAEAAVIKKIEILGYRNDGKQIVVTATNSLSYNRLEEAIIVAGFPKPDFFSKDMKTIRLSTPNKVLLTNFINAIKIAEPDLVVIENTLAQLLAIELHQTYSMPIWLKKGNFQELYNSGASLNRWVEYNSTVLGSIVKQLELLGYWGGDRLIVVTASNKKSYLRLKQAIRAIGFPEPDFDDDTFKTIRCHSQDAALQTRFLEAIIALEPSLGEIKQELFESLAISSDARVLNSSTWTKIGNFQHALNTGEMRIIRQATYSNTDPNADISKLRLFGYRDGTITLKVEIPNPELRQQFINSLNLSGFEASTTLTFNQATRANSEVFLNALQIMGDFRSILHDIRADIAAALAPVPSPSPSTLINADNNPRRSPLRSPIVFNEQEIISAVAAAIQNHLHRHTVRRDMSQANNHPNRSPVANNTPLNPPAIEVVNTLPMETSVTSSLPISHQSSLNGTQKNIIEGVLSFPFDSIDSLEKQEDKLKVLHLITKPEITIEEQAYLEHLDILAEVMQIKEILNHPYPQNRAQDYPYFGRQGVPEDSVVYKDTNGRPAHEPRGLLGLTARSNNTDKTITKEDVCAYIAELITAKIAALSPAVSVETRVTNSVGHFFRPTNGQASNNNNEPSTTPNSSRR